MVPLFCGPVAQSFKCSVLFCVSHFILLLIQGFDLSYCLVCVRYLQPLYHGLEIVCVCVCVCVAVHRVYLQIKSCPGETSQWNHLSLLLIRMLFLMTPVPQGRLQECVSMCVCGV